MSCCVIDSLAGEGATSRHTGTALVGDGVIIIIMLKWVLVSPELIGLVPDYIVCPCVVLGEGHRTERLLTIEDRSLLARG